MNDAIPLLFTVGLVLLGFEVIVPGAVLGLIGGLCLLGGVVVAFVHHGSAGGLLALLTAIGAVGLMLYLEFRVLPRTRLGRRMFLRSEIDGASQPPVASANVIGADAVALTPLSPSGWIELDGRRYEARCDSGYADAGDRVRITRVETFHLVVIATS